MWAEQAMHHSKLPHTTKLPILGDIFPLATCPFISPRGLETIRSRELAIFQVFASSHSLSGPGILTEQISEGTETELLGNQYIGVLLAFYALPQG